MCRSSVDTSIFDCKCGVKVRHRQPHETLEALSHRGYAPTLLYDDDGHWLVTDMGLQPLDPTFGEFSTFVNATEQWYDTITDAVNAYLSETGENLDEIQS